MEKITKSLKGDLFLGAKVILVFSIGFLLISAPIYDSRTRPGFIFALFMAVICGGMVLYEHFRSKSDRKG